MSTRVCYRGASVDDKRARWREAAEGTNPANASSANAAMSEDLTPVLVGAGQFTQRDVELEAAREPLVLMVEASRRAAADAGAGERLLADVDSVAVVNILGWQYSNPPRLLAEQLGAHPAEELYSGVGGNTPQWLVNETAAKIAGGRVGLALIAGAEAMRSVKLAARRRIALGWTSADAGSPVVVGDLRPGNDAHEVAHGLQLPAQIYPVFENALRTRRGTSIPAHREQVGALWARFAAVAAENPYAWFRDAKSAREITTVTAQNRMVGFPYTKYMNAVLDVDQAAAVLMTSASRARALGIDASRWVYLHGCADTNDHWFVSERVNYHTSPAIRTAARVALTMARASVEDVAYFDLYSCFPCAVQIARDMIGIPEDDEHALTITGGLAFHGGPGSNYTMHAIATMMARLRAQREAVGLVSGLGWYMTKHSIGIYGGVPKDGPAWSRPEPATYQAEIDRMPHPALAIEAGGRGVIETYTVWHDREGEPGKGIVIGRLEDGRRFLANTPADRELLEEMRKREAVGRSGRVSPAHGGNRFVPD